MKPILFNIEMVRAILDGRKTVTRRVVKPQPEGKPYKMPDGSCWPGYFGTAKSNRVFAPPYQLGDILYVRETWTRVSDWTTIDPSVGMPDGYIYRADWPDDGEHPRWHPSIHMPKEAARIFLRVTDVRVELLQDINERGTKSAEHEGFVNDINLFDGGGASATRHFADLWDTTVKPTDRDCYGWAANPWVWVIEFEQCEKPEKKEMMIGGKLIGG